MAYDVLDNVYSIFMDVKTGVGGSSGSNTFYNTDVNTSFIEIILTERDKNLTMTDYTYIVSVDKADGTSYVNRYTASEANKMSIKLDTQLLACVGECTAQLYVLKDDKVRTMMEFNYFVKNGVFDGAKPPSHNEDSIYIALMKDFTTLKDKVIEAIGKMDGIETSIRSVTDKADTNTRTINEEKEKTKANTSAIVEQGNAITQNKKDIKANTAEINKAKTATTGEKFGSVSERIDAEVNRINNKIEVSFVPQEEAESHTILNTVEGMSTDMVVKGKTLQNIFPSDPAKLSISSGSISDGLITINAQTSTYGNMWDVKNPLYKTNTKYSVIIDILENTLVKGENTQLNQDYLFIGKSGSQNDSVFSGARSLVIGDGSKGRYVIPLETISDFSTMTNNYGARIFLSNVFIGGQLKLKIMILEGDWTNKPIPEYFEGIKSFGQEEGKISSLSRGKNLLNPSLGKPSHGGITISRKNDAITLSGNADSLNNWSCLEIPIYLPKGNWYFSYKAEGNGFLRVSIVDAQTRVTISGDVHPTLGKTFQNDKDRDVIARLFLKGDKETGEITNKYWDMQLEEGTKATPYEPYKQDKKDILLSELGFDEGLRGLSLSVCDELNDIENVTIKRIEKIVINDINVSEIQDRPNAQNTNWFQTDYISNTSVKSGGLNINNKLIGVTETQAWSDTNDFECLSITSTISGARIKGRVNKGVTSEQLKERLKGLIVYYELAEPVETPLTDPINVKTFNEKTYVSFINALKGTSSFKTPVDTIQTIARLTSENKSLLSSNAELDAKVTEAVNKNQQLKEEAIATQSALDYILMNNLKA